MITDKPVLPVGELHNLRALEVKGLQRDEDGWTLYWSDGNRLVTHQTTIKDKRTAGEVLDNMLLNYIQDKGESGRMDTLLERWKPPCHASDHYKGQTNGGRGVGQYALKLYSR